MLETLYRIILYNKRAWRHHRLNFNTASSLSRKWVNCWIVVVLRLSDCDGAVDGDDGRRMWTSCLEWRHGTESSTCYRYPRWNLVSSVSVGISSSLFPKILRETGREGETAKEDEKESCGDVLTWERPTVDADGAIQHLDSYCIFS